MRSPLEILGRLRMAWGKTTKFVPEVNQFSVPTKSKYVVPELTKAMTKAMVGEDFASLMRARHDAVVQCLLRRMEEK